MLRSEHLGLCTLSQLVLRNSVSWAVSVLRQWEVRSNGLRKKVGWGRAGEKQDVEVLKLPW
jgi:hypothetical protein